MVTLGLRQFCQSLHLREMLADAACGKNQAGQFARIRRNAVQFHNALLAELVQQIIGLFHKIYIAQLRQFGFLLLPCRPKLAGVLAQGVDLGEMGIAYGDFLL